MLKSSSINKWLGGRKDSIMQLVVNALEVEILKTKKGEG